MNFSWSGIDTTFLKEIIKASDIKDKDLYLESDDADALAGCVSTIAAYPDRKFIMKYRRIIEEYLIFNYHNEVRKICKSMNIDANNYNEKQIILTEKPLSQNLINAYEAAILNIQGMDVSESEYSSFRYTRSLNMPETEIEDVPLYDFQKKAVSELSENFIRRDKDKGMLVMPTGSGKTRTATYFLIKEMISRGYQIIWIAHRHQLIDQAADCFLRFAGLSKIENPDIKNYRITCISGKHMRISQADRHEVIVASIASICKNKPYLRFILAKKVMIVVDEAHHTFAPTYQKTINFIKSCRENVKLLGLTATPVRGNETDSHSLLKLYDNNIIYSITMSELIAKGILSTPKFIRKETGEDFEPVISLDEERLIRKYGELPETLVNKIASSNKRNKVIVDEYLENKSKYGKTLIFAMNVLHCRLLHEEFRKHRVKCGLIFSGKEDNNRVISDFKENKYDVLINVNIMTEGTDVPDIQTVFITRPTQSEGFLMQMIGRGMRGVLAGGTETVNIIDFYDKWDVFNKWLNPEWLIKEETDEPEIKYNIRRKTVLKEYEWSLCKEIYKGILFRGADSGERVLIPVGWYSLVNQDGEDAYMIVFESQLYGIKKMLADKKSWKDDTDFTAEDALSKYFSYFGDLPAVKDLDLLMYNIRFGEEIPCIHLFENRKKIDPFYVVKMAEEKNLDITDYAAEIYENNPVAADLYESKDKYIFCVLSEKLYGNKAHHIGQKVEELPLELIPFDCTPVYDIDELVQEVKDEMFGGKFDGLGTISWTDKPYKHYYGIHYSATHNILINCILNSKDVPREAVKYVIYHEMLHRDNMSHDVHFRKEEHKYPHYEEWDHFLDGTMSQFDIEEW